MLSRRWKLLSSADVFHSSERAEETGKDTPAIGAEFRCLTSQIARELPRELHPDGLPRGTKFSELEAVAGTLGDEMARQPIEINVQGRADARPEPEPGEWPVCGRAARRAPDEPRALATTRGDGAWKRRFGKCPRCRRAFFPSEK